MWGRKEPIMKATLPCGAMAKANCLLCSSRFFSRNRASKLPLRAHFFYQRNLQSSNVLPTVHRLNGLPRIHTVYQTDCCLVWTLFNYLPRNASISIWTSMAYREKWCHDPQIERCLSNILPKKTYTNTQQRENIMSARITKLAKNKKEEGNRTWKDRFSTFFGKSFKEHMLCVSEVLSILVWKVPNLVEATREHAEWPHFQVALCDSNCQEAI